MSFELAFKNLTLTQKRLVSENNKLKAKNIKLNRINKEFKKELNEFKLVKRQKSLVPDRSTIHRRKANVKHMLALINTEISKIGYEFEQIYIRDKNLHQVNEYFSIEYVDKRESRYHTALKCLYYKDLSGMSDRSYHIFRDGMALGSKIAPLCYLKRLRKTYSINLNAKSLSTGKFINLFFNVSYIL